MRSKKSSDHTDDHTKDFYKNNSLQPSLLADAMTAPEKPAAAGGKKKPPKAEIESPDFELDTVPTFERKVRPPHESYPENGAVLFKDQEPPKPAPAMEPEKPQEPEKLQGTESRKTTKTHVWASNYDADNAAPVNILSTAELDEGALGIFDSFKVPKTKEPEEHFFANTGSGYSHVDMRMIEDDDQVIGLPDWRSVDTDKLVAVLHTHPPGWYTYPPKAGPGKAGKRYKAELAPGDSDFKVVEAFGVPAYIEYEGRVAVLEIKDGQWSFRVINGRLTWQERRSTQKMLNIYQKDRRALNR